MQFIGGCFAGVRKETKLWFIQSKLLFSTVSFPVGLSGQLILGFSIDCATFSVLSLGDGASYGFPENLEWGGRLIAVSRVCGVFRS